MDEINNLRAFIKVVERSSFTAAAVELNCSPSSISKRINQLEHTVGTTLLNRSTHGTTSLTESGAAYFKLVQKIVHELENAKESVKNMSGAIQGSLKVHLTPGSGQRLVLPAVLEFSRCHPSLSMEVSVSPETYDILDRGFDVSIHSGSKSDDELNYAKIDARELVPAQYVICAAPAYFERYGVPSHPLELAQHNCLVSTRQPSSTKWWFFSEGKRFAVQVQGNFTADNWATVYEAAKSGLGIARMLCVNPEEELGGVLQPIFQQEVISNRSVWALTPRMRPTSRKIEVFLKFLAKELHTRSLRHWDRG